MISKRFVDDPVHLEQIGTEAIAVEQANRQSRHLCAVAQQGSPSRALQVKRFNCLGQKGPATSQRQGFPGLKIGDPALSFRRRAGSGPMNRTTRAP